MNHCDVENIDLNFHAKNCEIQYFFPIFPLLKILLVMTMFGAKIQIIQVIFLKNRLENFWTQFEI